MKNSYGAAELGLSGLDYAPEIIPEAKPPHTEISFVGFPRMPESERFEAQAGQAHILEEAYEKWQAQQAVTNAVARRFEQACHWFLQRSVKFHEALSAVEDEDGLERLRTSQRSFLDLMGEIARSNVLIDPRRDHVLIGAFSKALEESYYAE